MPLTPSEFADRIRRLRATREEILDQQGFFGLPQTGVVDWTAPVMASGFCGYVPSIVQGGVARWGNPQDIRYYLDSATLPGGISVDSWRKVMRVAADAWQAVCGVKLTEVTTATASNVIVLGDRRDGSSGVLADAELPYGAERSRALLLTFDNAENWATGIDPYAVATHELGHILGFDHIDARQGVALMNSMYSPRVVKPTAVDIAVASKRYGPAVAKPVPSAPAAGEETLVITLKGKGLDFAAQYNGLEYVLTRGA